MRCHCEAARPELACGELVEVVEGIRVSVLILNFEL